MTNPPSGWLVLKWPLVAGFEVATDIRNRLNNLEPSLLLIKSHRRAAFDECDTEISDREELSNSHTDPLPNFADIRMK